MSHGVVVLYAPPGHTPPGSHESVTRHALASRLAALIGCPFAGEHDPARCHPGPVYFVPGVTLLEATARELGIRGEHDLFGGVVPHPFVATKAISHPLVAPAAHAPEGWSHDFPAWVQDAALAGFTSFDLDDACRAGRRLLERGPVRLKPVRATGGRGQAVLADAAALDAALEAIDAVELATHGLVLEENLAEVATYSVGQVRAAGLVASYYGTQRLTPDNDGATVYGGSDLVLVPGGFEGLLALELPTAVRHAVAQARVYDAAASACFPGLLVSRRNYDVAQGLDAAGRPRSGVLEQSWRIGGASGAEILALEAFRADPALRQVRASTVELYGEDAQAPPHASVLFRGWDAEVGFLTKYALVEADADPR
jgi:hypothetical protein